MVKSYSLQTLRPYLLVVVSLVSALLAVVFLNVNNAYAEDVPNNYWDSFRIVYTENTYRVEQSSSGLLTLTITSDLYRNGRYTTPIAPSSTTYSIVNLASPPCGNEMGGFEPVFRSTDGRDNQLSISTVYNMLKDKPQSSLPNLRLSLLSTSPKTKECYDFAAKYASGGTVEEVTQRKVNVDDARTVAAYKSAGVILAEPLATYQTDYSAQAAILASEGSTSLTAIPAACANIGGTWNCGKESFQIFLGKCWASANNTFANSPTSIGVEAAVKSGFSRCVSTQIYGNLSKATAILEAIKGITYDQVQQAVSASDKQLIEDKADELRVEVPPSDTSDLTVSTSTCDIEGIGWIVCPVVHFMSNIVDAAYDGIVLFLNVPPLEVDPVTLATNRDPLYSAWQISRNLANVAFIIVFLVVIYSQITSMGISNYGLKRILPKLIVAAILVNLSYWICALAVDVSNVVGHSLTTLFEYVNNLGTGGSTPVDGSTIDNSRGLSSFAGGVLVAGAAAGTAAFSYSGIAIFLPLLIASLVSVFVVFILLTLRQAFIILAIVIAPLAFVAYLLPNTEGLYKKWFGLFKTLLLLFPIIAAVFGGAKLAGTIVMRSSDNTFVDMAGAAMMILPLFVVPTVLKSAGGVLNRIGGLINNPNKGPIDGMKKGAERFRERQENRRAIQSMSGRRIFGGGGRFRRKARTEAIDSSLKRERANQEQQSIAREASDEDGNATVFGRKLAGAGVLGGGADAAAIQRALASAHITIDEATAKDIKAEAVMVQKMDATALKEILTSDTSSDERKAAAMQRLVMISDPGDFVDSKGNTVQGYSSQVNAALAGGSDTLRRATAEALAKNGPGFLKAGDIDRFATGSHTDEHGNKSTLESVAEFNVSQGAYSQEKMVEAPLGDLQFAFQNAGIEGQNRMIATAAALKANENLVGKIKHNAKAIDNLSAAKAPNTP